MTRREYGTGSIYQRTRDGRWVGTLEGGFSRTGARRRIVVTGKTEAAVKRKLRDRKKALQDGQAEASRPTTIKKWADTWLERTAATSRPKTYTTDLGAVGKWIVPTIGHRRLDQLTPTDVHDVSKAVRAAGLSSSTANRYHETLHRMLEAARRDGKHVPPLVLDVDPPAKAAHDRTALTTPEALAALEVASHLPHGSRWVGGMLQGMRQGECLGLTWPETNLDDGYLTVSWQLQSLPYLDPNDKRRGFRIPDGYEARQVHKTYHLVRPKTKAGWRVIPLVPWMRQALTAWRAVAPESPAGLVWPNVHGGPANIRHDTLEWQAIQGTAGIGHPNGRYYHGHELRNTTATILLELGVPESVRIAILGHSSIQVTRGYEVVAREQALKALEAAATRLQLT